MIPFLDPRRPPAFPDPEKALAEPDGLLAAGGALDRRFLEAAYSDAIFPWFSGDEPILWWSPSRRAVIEPSELRVSRSLSKTLRNKPWTVRLDADFGRMVELCATQPREGQDGTWIVPEMREAYRGMRRAGLAHSVEAFYDGEFRGGLFGIKLGGMFYGESMASLSPDASKVALAHLCLGAPALGVELIDCQNMTGHLSTMGARAIGRADLRARVAQLVKSKASEEWAGRLDGFDMAAALAARGPAEPAPELAKGRSPKP